jgi:hypothetical protein
VRESDAGEDGVVCRAFCRAGARRSTEMETTNGKVDFNSPVSKPKIGEGELGWCRFVGGNEGGGAVLRFLFHPA